MNAGEPYAPARDGFDNARLMMVVSRITSVAARKSAALAYGAWNPRFCSASAAEDALAFFGELNELIGHYAAQAIEARGAETGAGA